MESDYHKRIHVYMLLQAFNVPLKCDGGTSVAKLKHHDKIVTIGNRVYVPDDQVEGRVHGMPNDTMSEALFNNDFVELNPIIFVKL